MATIERSAYGTIATALDTGLNSLANNSTALSAGINNTTDHAIYHDLWLHIASFGAAPALNAGINLYILPSIDDGTTYADGTAGTPGTIPSPNLLVGTFLCRASAGAHELFLQRVEVPPEEFKYLLENKSGQTFASSLNTLKYRPHELLST